MGTQQPIGEIVETTSLYLVAQRLDPNTEATPRPVQPPNLGSLVWVHVPGGGRVFAVVSYGTTTGVDSQRRAVVRSHGEVLDDRVYREHPQLHRVLRTIFHAVLVGYETPQGTLHRHLPPQPPPLHYAVYPATPEETQRFSQDMRYFRLLLAVTSPVPGEQVTAAHVREIARLHPGNEEWVERAARHIARLLKRDYERLQAALEALAP